MKCSADCWRPGIHESFLGDPSEEDASSCDMLQQRSRKFKVLFASTGSFGNEDSSMFLFPTVGIFFFLDCQPFQRSQLERNVVWPLAGDGVYQHLIRP